jgi:hypothetical protein
MISENRIALEYVSAIFAILAALFWVLSTLGKMPNKFPIEVINWHPYDGENVTGAQVVSEGYGTSKELERLGKVLIRQSWFSAAAAFCAAVSAFSHAAAILLNSK